MSDQQSQIIVGLGNPGPKYARNRHNIGFMVLAELARREALVFQAAAEKYQWAEGPGFVLLKPLTYMNLSGKTLADWSACTGVVLTGRCDPEPESGEDEALPVVVDGAEDTRPLIVCDDLALPLGSVRLRARGRSGGQNGLASIIDHLGGEDFPRLRLGVAPLAEPPAPQDWADYVLADFTAAETPAVEELVIRAAEALACWLGHGLEATVSRFNRRIRPLD